jgi:hypothetical protein
MASEPETRADGRPTEAGSPARPSHGAESRDHGVTDDRIRERAHQIWIEEGQPNGRALDHWLRARWEIEGKAEPK